MLYLFDEVESLGDDFTERKIPLLSDDRRAKINRLREKNGKKESVVAYLLLRLALLEVYGISTAVEFHHLDKGKPVLRDHPNIHFSLSHTRNAAACVVSDSVVGVDVQNIRAVTDRAARRVLTEAEYNEFIDALNPNEYFCEIWAIKESYMKMTGQGIAAAFKQLPAEDIKNKSFFRRKDYFCSVCGTIAEKIRVKYIGSEDFEQLRT